MIALLLVSFLIPLLLSSFDILLGRNISVEYFSKVERHHGVFLGSHHLAYNMLFLVYFCVLYYHKNFLAVKFKNYLFIFLIFLSILCLYKSYTRTAFVGLMSFGFIYLYGSNKKKFLIALILLLFFALFNIKNLETIFWKTDKRNINTASSGRVEVWYNNIKVFRESTFPRKLIGLGLGVEGQYIKNLNTYIEPSHNDYLSLLVTLGVIGLGLYCAILLSLLIDVLNSKLKRNIKSYFLGLIISVTMMNFLSNAIIFRVELSQYFWLLIGMFYLLNENEIDKIGY